MKQTSFKLFQSISVLGFLALLIIPGDYAFLSNKIRYINRLVPGSTSIICRANDFTLNAAASDTEKSVDENLKTDDVSELTSTLEEGDEIEQEIDEKVLSPYELAVIELETQLRSELSSLEAILKNERMQLSKKKDSISESGKTGYYIVQAQVAEFQKKRDSDQKSRVKRNKREFVLKMLPVVDAFRSAREAAPPLTETEENMHKNFGSLLGSIVGVFQKFGFQEYDAGILNYEVITYVIKKYETVYLI